MTFHTKSLLSCIIAYFIILSTAINTITAATSLPHMRTPLPAASMSWHLSSVFDLHFEKVKPLEKCVYV